jgi:hypothetical protein
VNLTCHWSDLCRQNVLKVIFWKEFHVHCAIFLKSRFVMSRFLTKKL